MSGSHYIKYTIHAFWVLEFYKPVSSAKAEWSPSHTSEDPWCSHVLSAEAPRWPLIFSPASFVQGLQRWLLMPGMNPETLAGRQAGSSLMREREREVLVNHKTILVKNYYIFKSFVLIKQCENNCSRIKTTWYQLKSKFSKLVTPTRWKLYLIIIHEPFSFKKCQPLFPLLYT